MSSALDEGSDYSEDFDDATEEGGIRSLTYVEDFEDASSNFGNSAKRTCTPGEGSGSCSSNHQTQTNVESLVSQLASDRQIPSQICEVRQQLMDLVRTLHDEPGLNFSMKAEHFVEKSCRLGQLLEQVEINLSAERRNQNFASRGPERRAARARADERRAEHEERLVCMEQRARRAEQAEVAAKRRLRDADALLKNSEVLLKRTREARSRMETEITLQEQDIDDLKLRLSKISAASSTARKEMTFRVTVVEDRYRVLKIQRDLEFDLLQRAVDAAKRRHLNNAVDVSEAKIKRLTMEGNFLKHERLELHEDKLNFARYRARLETDYRTRQAQSEADFTRSLTHYKQGCVEEHAAHTAFRDVNDEITKSERQRLSRLQSALDTEKVAIARERAELDLAQSSSLKSFAKQVAKSNDGENLGVTMIPSSELERARCLVSKQLTMITCQLSVFGTLPQTR
mmetsp:Transcript_32762/g.101442  ORF Transcript_32762/g.101442 Transcript_32762/m.101442 type:complete len:456 (-) Transcript_32762:80-1447(-)